MSGTNLAIFLLCAPIMGQTTVLLNAPVGGSVLIHCYLPVHPLNLRWFYWQEDRSDNILFHWDAIGKTSPIADEYRNRCHLFNTEFTSGNISITLDNVVVGDDQKTFWAYVSYDKQKIQSEQWCKSTLQVSAPYQDLILTVNKTANSATCTAHGGYPEPQVSWSGLNKSSATQLDLQGAEMSLQQDATEKTFSVITSVSVKELQSVTCLIYNPHSNESLKKTTEIEAPGPTVNPPQQQRMYLRRLFEIPPVDGSAD
ncbi:butyrophilin-like protein 2 isoform X2 [Micropterus salmoides]|uniref:butyrophilin-like protein 2 isoform X2 n=1 Tax=Micropterus salmoides TaxID=27706 RepID=UPI0018EB5663|nr:butyrophilin-like protein 2 isoform X2 [Micropterus salmoides]